MPTSVKSRDAARAAVPRPQDRARPPGPGSSGPVDDPVRERRVPEAVVRTAGERGAPCRDGVPPVPAAPAGGELPLDTPRMTAPHGALGSVRRP
ncbi:hypothetical protein ACFV9P_01905 [Streptomyces sp. NPDC059892]|uniref:hypothetical protein n=1 Tax=Streptomyces sp. NPDC059892 TaxID=3346989 RepID=UPI00364689D3